MATMTSFEAVFHTLVFVVPGFIVDSVLSALVPQRAQPAERSVLRLLTFSAINYALWSWLIYLLVASPAFSGNPWTQALGWVVVMGLGPDVLGLVLGTLQQRGFVKKILSWFGVSAIHPIPRAWDWAFATGRAGWALVTLKNGHRIAGLFGPGSFASSDPAHPDLYLEALYRRFPSPTACGSHPRRSSPSSSFSSAYNRREEERDGRRTADPRGSRARELSARRDRS